MTAFRSYMPALLVVLGMILLSACSDRGVPSPAASPTVNQESSKRDVQNVWQPPEPSAYYYEVLPTPTSPPHPPDTIIIYRSSGQTEELMTITEKGVAQAYFHRETTSTLQLSPDRLTALQTMFDEADFFDLQDIYYNPEPDPLATIDVADAHAGTDTITYVAEGRSKTVSGTFRSSPEELGKIISTLSYFYYEVLEKGVRQASRPDLLVSYYLAGSKQRVWIMNIDVEGGISYLGYPPTSRLTSQELEELREMFEQAGPLGDWYMAPSEQRDIMNERRAIVGYYRGSEYEDVNILTGATIPAELELILRKLAQIYDKYAPPGSIT